MEFTEHGDEHVLNYVLHVGGAVQQPMDKLRDAALVPPHDFVKRRLLP